MGKNLDLGNRDQGIKLRVSASCYVVNNFTERKEGKGLAERTKFIVELFST